jgi:predicted HicB family RNase H-like nuclease
MKQGKIESYRYEIIALAITILHITASTLAVKSDFHSAVDEYLESYRQDGMKPERVCIDI